ncbi:MAG: TIR domain-containing protein [Ilumatobacteraceae bacterium]
MRIFVSYARRDREAVDALLQDIRRARHDVWVDEELTGGQAWWSTILGTIRGADLFVVALSPDWLNSKACNAELQYAVACNRSVLPIMVARVSPQMAPPAVANAQILDYVERTPDAAISLVTALSMALPAALLPQPLPPEPLVPMSYMNTFRERVDELSLSFQQQSMLLSELRAHLSDEDDRDSATELIRRLRRRGDITESIGKEIDALLITAAASATTAPTSTAQSDLSSASVIPAGWYPDPYGRYAQRYWDGTTWTEHASTGGGQVVDSPSSGSQPIPNAVDPQTIASATVPPAATAKWDTGTFITLLIVSLIPCIGIIGIIVGAVNLKKPARRGQALVLLAVGIGITVAVLANASFNTSSDAGI